MIKLNAKMVMESRGIAPSVRSVGLHSNWSRLYQAEEFYLDLMLKPKEKTSSLLGQLLSESDCPLKGEVMLSQADQEVSKTRLGRDADFLINIDQAGTYELTLTLEDTSISLYDLALN